MSRPRKHGETAILEAAARLVAAAGPAAATMSAVGRASGAPNGSLYHCFGSRDVLLGRLWLDKAAYFHDRARVALAHPDAREAALGVALSIPRAAREDFDAARIMMLHHRRDFAEAGWPQPMQEAAERLGQEIAAMLDVVARRVFGAETVAAREAATFAVIDVPFGAVHRFVAGGRPPPAWLDPLIAAAHRGAVAAFEAA